MEQPCLRDSLKQLDLRARDELPAIVEGIKRIDPELIDELRSFPEFPPPSLRHTQDSFASFKRQPTLWRSERVNPARDCALSGFHLTPMSTPQPLYPFEVNQIRRDDFRLMGQRNCRDCNIEIVNE